MPDMVSLYENKYTKNLEATKESGKDNLERRHNHSITDYV